MGNDLTKIPLSRKQRHLVKHIVQNMKDPMYVFKHYALRKLIKKYGLVYTHRRATDGTFNFFGSITIKTKSGKQLIKASIQEPLTTADKGFRITSCVSEPIGHRPYVAYTSTRINLDVYPMSMLHDKAETLSYQDVMHIQYMGVSDDGSSVYKHRDVYPAAIRLCTEFKVTGERVRDTLRCSYHKDGYKIEFTQENMKKYEHKPFSVKYFEWMML